MLKRNRTASPAQKGRKGHSFPPSVEQGRVLREEAPGDFKSQDPGNFMQVECQNPQPLSFEIGGLGRGVISRGSEGGGLQGHVQGQRPRAQVACLRSLCVRMSGDVCHSPIL